MAINKLEDLIMPTLLLLFVLMLASVVGFMGLGVIALAHEVFESCK